MFCLKNGGIMKKVQKNKDKIPLIFGSENNEMYYHLFCGFIFGKFKDIVNIVEFKVSKSYYTNIDKNVCYICDQK